MRIFSKEKMRILFFLFARFLIQLKRDFARGDPCFCENCMGFRALFLRVRARVFLKMLLQNEKK
jgi:hypothetical protein